MIKTRHAPLSLLALSLVLLAACGDTAAPSPDASVADTAVDDTAQDTVAATDAADAAVDSGAPDTGAPAADPDCDPLDPSFCALPWPSNLYLVPDATRVTGYTLTFGAQSLPKNDYYGNAIAPEPYRRRDGYGLHTPLMVRLPNVDTRALPSEYDGAGSLAADAAILWFAVAPDGSLTRVPYFVDIDVPQPDPAARLLIVRPAVLLAEGTRYVVALRGLEDTSGQPLTPSPAFAALKAGATAADAALAPRQARFDDLFALLAGAGVAKDSLLLAWDFVTASSDALHGWMLDVRDQAFAATGEDGPEITIDSVTSYTPEEDSQIAMDLVGTFRVPHFMEVASELDGVVTWRAHLGADGRPAQDGWVDAPLWVRIPRSALSGEAHDLMLYGHGQNGRGSQVRGGFLAKLASDHHFILAATDMWGMSEEDVNGIVQTLMDMSGFTRVSDRLLQGVVNHALLARAMRKRLPALAALAGLGLSVNTDQVYYSGISQGGIYGSVVVAVAPDIPRGHLGVPGNDYSFLLARSKNFKPFLALLNLYYPDRASQLVTLQAVQLLWDGADPASYLRRLATPLPGCTAKSVLLAPAKGDPQVAVSSNEWVVRSDIGVALMANYDDERTVWGVTEAAYPHQGSGLVLYDFGNPWPAGSANAPPTSEADDPHERPRRLDAHNAQLAHFLRTGEIIDVCGGDGCHPE